MIYLDELRLQLNDARVSFEKLPKKQQESLRWSDWYAETMIANGVQMDKDDLAMLLREADVAYRTEPEQHAWTDYVSKYLYLQLQK